MQKPLLICILVLYPMYEVMLQDCALLAGWHWSQSCSLLANESLLIDWINRELTQTPLPPGLNKREAFSCLHETIHSRHYLITLILSSLFFMPNTKHPHQRLMRSKLGLYHTEAHYRDLRPRVLFSSGVKGERVKSNDGHGYWPVNVVHCWYDKGSSPTTAAEKQSVECGAVGLGAAIAPKKSFISVGFSGELWWSKCYFRTFSTLTGINYGRKCWTLVMFDNVWARK